MRNYLCAIPILAALLHAAQPTDTLPVKRLTSGYYVFLFSAGEYRVKRGVVVIR